MGIFSFTTIAILSALFAAIANILARVLLKDLKSKDILSVNFMILGLTLLVLSPFFWEFTLTKTTILFILLIALIDLFANYFHFKTFEKTDAGTATPLLSLAPLFTFVFGWIFLGESLTLMTALLAAAIVFGLIMFSVDFKNFGPFNAATLTPALLASFLFGISAIPTKYLLHELATINAPSLFMLRAFTITLIAIPFFGFALRHISKKQLSFMGFRGLFVIAQWVLLYIALTLGSTGVTVTLGNITPIFVFILSIGLLGEKPTWRKASAAVTILALSLLI